MDQIDVIFYINLDSRLDRKEHFLKEVKKLCLDDSKIVRIDATKHANGALGCTKSHIKTLEQFMANDDWRTCIVFEDDFTFHNSSPEYNDNLLASFFYIFSDWGLLLLASNLAGRPTVKTNMENVIQVTYSQTTSGYVIHKDTVKTVYDNFKKSEELLEKSNNKRAHAVDIYWNSMNIKRYAFKPNMGYQYDNFSDIEQRTVRYNC